MMTPKQLRVAGLMLDAAADKFSNHCCNDWEFPADWTVEEKRDFVREMYEDNGDPENFDPDRLNVPDWWVMRFLAEKLMNATEATP